jgi:hypothetical protein
VTKSLMVMAANATQATTSESNLAGAATAATTTEVNTQMAATQDATFSLLGCNIISGGSGTNNMQFRDAGGNGNQLATRAGTGLATDAVNTDSLTAADLFNVAFTDTGTDPVHSWLKVNVAFASGHGCFHASAAYAGINNNNQSDTRYNSLNGGLISDGTGTEAAAQLKNRAYNNWAAIQVRVTANSRTTDTVFTNRINAGNGTGVVTFGSGVTGLLQDTAIGDAVADGDLLDVLCTTSTGTQNITVTFIGATFTSAGTKSEVAAQLVTGSARAASSTASYVPLGGNLGTLAAGYTEAQSRVPVGFDGVASNLRCFVGANTYGGTATLKLIQNGSAVITTNITAAGANQWYENTSDTVTFVAADTLSFELDEGTSGSATFHTLAITLEDVPASAGQPTWKRWGGVENMGGPRTSQGARVW